MTDIRKLLRPNIAALKPYSSARHEFTGRADIFLDANESPFPTDINRYPDPLQSALKKKVGAIYGTEPDQIFFGNGSDEAIDILIRSFCEPQKESVLTLTPTYGMYRVSADINAVEVIEVPLTDSFTVDHYAVRSAIEKNQIKLIFACSPNNPTGNKLADTDIAFLLSFKNTIVVLDEAYADFTQDASQPSDRLKQHNNLVILRTFSKAWGMAGARLGIAFASHEIIEVLNGVKPPYNINSLTQSRALDALDSQDVVYEQIRQIIFERERCSAVLSKMDIVERVYPSDANFLLVKFRNSEQVFRHLAARGIIVRDRRSAVAGCLRLTIGTKTENEKLIEALIAIT